MPDDLPVGRGLTIPGGELRERFSRSSGPGGQSVNTSDSRVTLSWDVGATTALSPARRDRVLERLAGRLTGGVLSVTSETERSQLLNRREARDRLAALVEEALAPPPRKRRPTRPTKGSQQRRLDAKKQRGQTKRLRQERF
ncbi:alternative ribosome rescue aminoacyl-tRNA hydrolase ArfB [Nocardioides marmoribigeumensis]|jgi:ribosome-associated protein|uniref:alternative ribosome rescue aminoacyl-tRNA hydrolase ArfB n=1 Tax=Nocardioides marmoribigeumensis TaxID=433649 RepID=UPI00286C8B44|nr:alternative ribosome rescue aminoacyl-tRNA hydrolase ArfB [Nocardioides marmoribigeumensis]